METAAIGFIGVRVRNVNKLTVRQFQQPINQDLAVILDLYCPKGEKIEGEMIEKTISLAATLVVEQCRQQGSTQLSISSASAGGFSLHGMASPVFRREAMERLAVVEKDTNDILPAALGEVLTRAAANARIVLISLVERDLADTKQFKELWQRTDVRRSIGDILRIQAGTQSFSELFQIGQTDSVPSQSNSPIDTTVQSPSGQA